MFVQIKGCAQWLWSVVMLQPINYFVTFGVILSTDWVFIPLWLRNQCFNCLTISGLSFTWSILISKLVEFVYGLSIPLINSLLLSFSIPKAKSVIHLTISYLISWHFKHFWPKNVIHLSFRVIELDQHINQSPHNIPIQPINEIYLGHSWHELSLYSILRSNRIHVINQVISLPCLQTDKCICFVFPIKSSFLIP